MAFTTEKELRANAELLSELDRDPSLAARVSAKLAGAGVSPTRRRGDGGSPASSRPSTRSTFSVW